MKYLKLLGINLLVFLLLWLLFMGALEWYLRQKGGLISHRPAVGLPIFQPSFLNTYEHRPFARVGERIMINDAGLRNKTLTTEAKTPSILFLGDSFTFGLGVSQNEVFARVLQNLIPSFQIWNAGVIGYSMDNYYVLLKKLYPILKPKVVVVNIFVGNDITELRRKKWIKDKTGDLVRVKDLKIFVNSEGKLQSYDRPIPLLWSWYFLQEKFKTLFLRLGLLEVKKTPTLTWPVFLPPNHPASDPNLESYWERFFWAMEAIHRFGKNQKVPILFVIIPMDTQVDTIYWEKYLPRYFDEEAFRAKRPQRRILEFCESKQLSCLDLLPLFQDHPNKKEIYFLQKSDPHFSPKGHEVFADILFSFLKPWIHE